VGVEAHSATTAERKQRIAGKVFPRLKALLNFAGLFGIEHRYHPASDSGVQQRIATVQSFVAPRPSPDPGRTALSVTLLVAFFGASQPGGRCRAQWQPWIYGFGQLLH